MIRINPANLLKVALQGTGFVRRGSAFFRVWGDGVLQVLKFERLSIHEVHDLSIGIFSMYGRLYPEWFTSSGCIPRGSIARFVGLRFVDHYLSPNCFKKADNGQFYYDGFPVSVDSTHRMWDGNGERWKYYFTPEQQIHILTEKVLPWLNNMTSQTLAAKAMYEIEQTHLTSIIMNFPAQTIPFELRTFTDNYQIKPSLGWMQKELSDYLLSQNTIPHLDNKNIYGISAQEALSQYILQTTNTIITSDLLYMYRFIEHKTLMAERVHGLYKMEVCPEEIYNLSEHISLLANELILPSFGDELSVAHATNFVSTVHAITTIELSCYPLLQDCISKALPLRNQ